ncbi:hypothetical protein GCM10028857_18170 [Salinarchaeum chitinilyticum]
MFRRLVRNVDALEPWSNAHLPALVPPCCPMIAVRYPPGIDRSKSGDSPDRQESTKEGVPSEEYTDDQYRDLERDAFGHRIERPDDKDDDQYSSKK